MERIFVTKVVAIVVIGLCKDAPPNCGSSGAIITVAFSRLCLRCSDSIVLNKLDDPNEEKTRNGQMSYVMLGDVRRDHS